MWGCTLSKLPAILFYPGDWMKDPALRSCSLAARGLWIDLLCLMHESDRRGYLQHANGKPVSKEQAARMTGSSTEEVSRLLQELEDSGVYSCTEHGAIYSRRMVADESKRAKCAEAGRKGGNPALTLKGASKGGSKGPPKGESNRLPTPSSSSSDSNAEEHKTGAAAPPFPSVLDREDFRKAWDDYLAYRREAKLKRLQPRSISAQFTEMVAWGPGIAIQAIRTTIAKGWTGIFEPKGEFGRPVKPPPKPGPEKLSDAGQAEFKAWWGRQSRDDQEAFAKSKGVAFATVDQAVNWRKVPATWATTGATA